MREIEIKPSFREFARLAKKGNLIPIYAELMADLETPVSSFLKICHSDYAYLLESVEEQEKVGRYSFLSSNPSKVFKSKGNKIEIEEFRSGRKSKSKFITTNDPLAEIRNILNKYKYVPLSELPRFCGGFVGYMAYDMVRFFENIPDKNKDDLNLPDSVFMLSDNLLIFDHIEHKIIIVSNVFIEDKNLNSIKKAYESGKRKIEQIYNEISKEVKFRDGTIKKSPAVKVSSNLSKDSFMKAVIRAKEYIRKGDIIQVVLSQRFKVPLVNKPIEIYRKLRSINPSPYMYYLKLKDFYIVGSSPELLLRCENGVVETRPIAGTKPRGKDEQEDEQLGKELLRDKKECAEHIMLVDLGRNDLGRVAKKGTVKVKDFMKIEKYSHVMHIVSSVVAKLDKKFDIYDALASCFPAGTLSGAPKIRAMEIIDEIENLHRGTYGGCIGYFSFSGNLDTCITIRTIVIKDGLCYIQAGAGIVADSVPLKEYKETQNKAKALIESITTR